MTTTTQTPPAVKPTRKPRPRPERRARISKPVNGSHALQLQVGEEVFRYWLERIPADQGHGFLLIKWEVEEGEPTQYNVNLHGPKGHTCECRGHLRWGHKTQCKHVASLLELIAEGKLIPLPSKPTSSPAVPCSDFDDNF